VLRPFSSLGHNKLAASQILCSAPAAVLPATALPHHKIDPFLSTLASSPFRCTAIDSLRRLVPALLMAAAGGGVRSTAATWKKRAPASVEWIEVPPTSGATCRCYWCVTIPSRGCGALAADPVPSPAAERDDTPRTSWNRPTLPERGPSIPANPRRRAGLHSVDPVGVHTPSTPLEFSPLTPQSGAFSPCYTPETPSPNYTPSRRTAPRRAAPLRRTTHRQVLPSGLLRRITLPGCQTSRMQSCAPAGSAAASGAAYTPRRTLRSSLQGLLWCNRQWSSTTVVLFHRLSCLSNSHVMEGKLSLIWMLMFPQCIICSAWCFPFPVTSENVSFVSSVSSA
jgi:hypothetical protein